MEKKIGRNDPCPCGSGKKYKNCHMLENPPNVRKKIKAKLISGGGIKPQDQPPDLMQRTFGNAIAAGEKEEKPPTREGSSKKE